jgi:hypothetical protein
MLSCANAEASADCVTLRRAIENCLLPDNLTGQRQCQVVTHSIECAGFKDLKRSAVISRQFLLCTDSAAAMRVDILGT